ncbi:MAG: hypothetical protein WCL00_07235 [Bacteroidota bacterium]
MRYLNNSVYLILITIVVLTASCSRKVHVQAVKKDLVIYPSPPDTARIQYLTSISSSDNTSHQRTGFSKYILGETLSKPVKKPYGVAIHGGKIYICDTGLGCIDIIDLEKGTFDYFVPDGKGKLKSPINCFVDENEYLYVADVLRKEIVIFNEKGDFVKALGDKENFKPTDVFVYRDRIFVANLFNNAIQVYGRENFELLNTFPKSVPGKEDYLFSPTNIYIRNDTLYVSDMGDFKVKLFSTEGVFLKSVGNLGTKVGQMVRPKGIAVDKESNLYVVDAGIENTQIFNREGKLLMFFGGTYQGPGGMWLPAKITIDYDHLKYFQKYVDGDYELNYSGLKIQRFE